MKEIIISAITISLIGTIARLILPRFEIFVKWLIKTLVKIIEKKVKGSGLGKIKKEKVLTWLNRFGVHSTEFVTTFIDEMVEVMNGKGSDVKTTMQNDIADKVVDKLEDTTKKIIK
jgi:hypothetical protein